MKTVQIKVRHVYGKPLIYPANDVAEQFCQLTGRKTFEHRDLQAMEVLGFTVEQVIDTPVGSYSVSATRCTNRLA